MRTDSPEWYEWSFKNDKKFHKIKTDEGLLQYYVESLENEFKEWNNINVNGCHDPLYSDGCNMNLVRNHILYYREYIVKLCCMRHLSIPNIMDRVVPDKVAYDYMANDRKLIGHDFKREEPKEETHKLNEQLQFAF